MSYLDRLRKALDNEPAPSLDDLLEQGDELFAREPSTPQGEADANAGIDESPDDVEPDEDDEDEPIMQRTTTSGRTQRAG
ncbi:MAG: hypothetical protein IMZ62_10715 [Chloroflexi bacterium]|nr:hypothetical protein [Chloroflexota bacterium]